MTGVTVSALTETAPAKINLALHVTGRRDDGYHLLESLVAFTAYGDEIAVGAADTDTFSVDGPFEHGVPAGGDNLVLRARDALRSTLFSVPPPLTPPRKGEGDSETLTLPSPLRGGVRGGGIAIRLTKNLPIASGVGGGSSDAAATLRALNRLWSLGLTDAQLAEIALPLGADLPMCLVARPLIARGIGEQIERVTLPEIPVVLVNPGVAVSTPAVFKALSSGFVHLPLEGGGRATGAGGGDKSLPPLPANPTLEALLSWLAATRNDLQAPAISMAPPIATALSALGQQGAALARMSGSGATCFGIFHRQADALRAAMAIRAAQPGWFVVATHAMA